MKLFIWKTLSLILLIIILVINSSIPIYFHKCSAKNVSFFSISEKQTCNHYSEEDIYHGAPAKSESSCSLCQSAEYQCDVNTTSSAKYSDYTQSCCFDYQLVLSLKESPLIQKFELQIKNNNFEFIPVSIFQICENSKVFVEPEYFQSIPFPRKYLLKFIHFSSHEKSGEDLPPLFS